MRRSRRLATVLTAAALLVGGGLTQPAAQAALTAVTPAVVKAPAALVKAPAEASSTVLATIGTTGHYAWQTQGILRKLGYIDNSGYTGYYGNLTAQKVRAFQRHVGLRQTGVVDRATLDKLLAAARGTVVFAKSGTSGHYAWQTQGWLRRLGYTGNAGYTGYYGSSTVATVRAFQSGWGLPLTGVTTYATYHTLRVAVAEYSTASADVRKYGLDPRCDDEAKVLCADQSQRKVYYLEGGRVLKVLDGRFGASSTPTRNGQWRIFRKNAKEWSNLYNVAMPNALYFSGGEAFHYSADFARIGWNNSRGGSHGCINLRDYNGWAWVFNRVQLNTLTIVTA